MQQAIIWTNNGLGYLHVYASLSLNESKKMLMKLLSKGLLIIMLQEEMT